MIARMTAEGVITLEPQNGAEVVALKHWQQENRRRFAETINASQGVPPGDYIRAQAIEVLVKD